MKESILIARQSFHFEKSLKFLVIALICALSAWGVYWAIGLAVDGASWLLKNLRFNTFQDWNKARLFANWITQLPVILALKYGVHDINLLIRIHSFGLVSIPSFFWIWAMLVQWNSDRFWYFLFAFSITYLNSGFQSVGEYNICYSMVALSTSLLQKDTQLKIRDYLILFFLSIALTCSYESMAFLGVLLYFIAISRWLSSKSICREDSSFARIMLLVLGMFYAMSVAIGAWFIVYPRLPGQLASARNIGPALTSWPGIYSLFILFIYLFSSVSKNRHVKNIALGLGTIASIGYLSKPSCWHDFWLYSKFRAIVGVVLFFVLFFLSIRFFYFGQNQNEEKTQNHVHFISFLFFLSLLIPFSFTTRDLGQWFRQFETEVNSKTGLIPWEASSLSSSKLGKKFYREHSNPSLSVILRQDDTKAIILASVTYKGWQPFDPKIEIYEIPKYFTKSKTLFND